MASPTSQWISQQLVEAFPLDQQRPQLRTVTKLRKTTAIYAQEKAVKRAERGVLFVFNSFGTSPQTRSRKRD